MTADDFRDQKTVGICSLRISWDLPKKRGFDSVFRRENWDLGCPKHQFFTDPMILRVSLFFWGGKR